MFLLVPARFCILIKWGRRLAWIKFWLEISPFTFLRSSLFSFFLINFLEVIS
jgi:hypothetical protein